VKWKGSDKSLTVAYCCVIAFVVVSRPLDTARNVSATSKHGLPCETGSPSRCPSSRQSERISMLREKAAFQEPTDKPDCS
jgi:hypothetical protein